jgi:DNA excision repair protein ERCC-5
MEGNEFAVAEVTDGNAMALEHAQATAANLTDWAGRAFRRAIAQHAQQTGGSEKTRHINVKETKPTEDSIESNFVVQDTAPSVKHASRPSVQYPFVTDESNGDRSVPSERANLNESALAGSLEGGAASFQEQTDLLNAEARRQERDLDTVTDEMRAEVIQLIQLFGIPYVESPAEAEAQCVKLEDLGLVDGIVTEDSDVFVFGGKSIYRNIFDDQKYVEVYLAKDAERELALGRNEMVALAMLLGCDYSEGVKGVGIVNGMEVLQAFDVSEGVKEGLTKFRKWLDGFDPDDARKKKVESDDELSAERKFSVKHKSARTQWNAPANFPADNVINAYLKPVVDSSSDHFSWGVPDLGKLLVFCQRNMGWEQSDTRKLLEPVLQRLEDSSRQTRLESFFMKYDDNIQFANVKSKRLREVFESSRKQSSSGNESPKKRARSKP